MTIPKEEARELAARTYKIPEPMPGVLPSGAKPIMASDSAFVANAYSYAALNAMYAEGLQFLGYAVLSEYAQRAEYRRPAEIIARQMTRKWMKLKAAGDGEDKADKIKVIEAELVRLKVQTRFREAAEQDGFFGRSQIFIDMGDENDDAGRKELLVPLSLTKAKLDGKQIKRLTVIEPLWTYPGVYDSNNPLDPAFFKPQTWYVLGKEVHASRLMTFVGREVPDLLKPAYAFGGLSLSQMAKPYVDNWLRTRQSVSDLVHSFSVPVLKMQMADILNSNGISSLLQRLQMFNLGRDNRGVFAIDKETEDFMIAAAPLGSLDKLQAQAQEHMSAVYGIPLIILFGITPSGLNASSESELKVFADAMESMQESLFDRHLVNLLSIIQIGLYGEVDPEIVIGWESLASPSEKERSDMRKSDGDTDMGYVNGGVLAPEEVRQKLADDPNSGYSGIVVEDVPEPPEAPGDPGDDDDDDDGASASDPPAPTPAPAPTVADVKKKSFPSFVSDAALGQDAEHWITVHPNGEEGEGRPLLIEGTPETGYRVKGGAGGKLDGREVTPKSMSGPRGGAAAPGPAPAALQSYADKAGNANAKSGIAHSLHPANLHDATSEALEAAHKAHQPAYEAHLEARDHPDASKEQKEFHQRQYMEHFEKRNDIRKETNYREQAQRAQELSDAANAAKNDRNAHAMAANAHSQASSDSRGTTDSRGRYRYHADKYEEHAKNVRRIDAAEKRAKSKAGNAAKVGTPQHEIESRFAKHTAAQIHEHFEKNYGMKFANGPDVLVSVRGHTHVDIEKSAKSAKTQRKILGHIDEAMKHLTARGYDLKKAMNGKVAYASGTPRQATGHAFYNPSRTDTRYFSLAEKAINEEKQAQYQASENRRAERGLLRWTIGQDAKTVAIHELAHAIGLQPDVQSPLKLKGILIELSKKMFPDERHYEGHISGKMHNWLGKNISEYGLTNIKETDAELAALVTHETYQRGSLPRELEDHVDRLFGKTV